MSQLTQGGSSTTGGAGSASAGGSVNAGILDIGYSAGGKSSASGGIQRNVQAVFSRETRNCHVCTQTITTKCSSSGGTKGFLGIGAKASSTNCSPSAPVDRCEDIPM